MLSNSFSMSMRRKGRNGTYLNIQEPGEGQLFNEELRIEGDYHQKLKGHVETAP